MDDINTVGLLNIAVVKPRSVLAQVASASRARTRKADAARRMPDDSKANLAQLFLRTMTAELP